MRKGLFILVFLVSLLVNQQIFAVSDSRAKVFSGQDLKLSASKLTMFSPEEGKHILLFEDNFSLSVGSNTYTSCNAVVWIEGMESDGFQLTSPAYKVRVFFDDNVNVNKGPTSKTTNIQQTVIEHGDSLMTGFIVSGEVFATAGEKIEADPRSSDIYIKAHSYLKPVRRSVKVYKDAIVPARPVPAEDVCEAGEEGGAEEPFFSWVLPPSLVAPEAPAEETAPEEQYEYKYPVNIAGVWEPSPKIEKTELADGTSAATVTGRFYLWQQQNNEGDILEFQADNGVVFYSGDALKAGEAEGESSDVVAEGNFKAVYFQGNIVMTEGSRTVRADEIYYDFENKQALIVNAEMRTYDESRQIPVYLRAKKLMQVCKDVYQADDIVLTSDEFYMPQISLTASSIIVLDTASVENRAAEAKKKARYQTMMEDIRLKLGKSTIFAWPKLTSGAERPDLPIKKIHIGNDNSFGTSVETDWYLRRLLGWQELPGVETTLAVDYYSKRGPAAGLDVEYANDDYYGEMVGFLLKDRGEDRLGRIDSRKDLEPDTDIRGRAMMRHRQYLPYDWQMTLEAGYLSDRNFLESFYRDEFYTGKEQETLIHLKRLKDNWAFAWLAKVRINDFVDELEELPTAQFHVVGQDLFCGKFTYYTHNTLGRMRQRYDNDSTTKGSQEFFTFATSRHELDMPFRWGKVKYVPYIAGTFAVDDGEGFDTGLNGATVEDENNGWLGEVGMRVSTTFWKTDPFVRSRLWDLNGLRHEIRPHAEFSIYDESDEAFEARDILNLGVAQKWQTKRGCEDDLRTVDWMRLDTNVTWVKNSGSTDRNGPNEFIFNDPSIPMFQRRTTDVYGVQRNSVDAEYQWNLSDTTAIMADMNYDMQNGQVQQVDVGITRYAWPNLTWYVGSRYLKSVVATNATNEYYEEGSNAVNFGITYKFSPRYALLFSQEYNFDYGQNVRSELALIRRYHRMFYGFTISMDESLDRNAIVFSIWPEGVKELAVGSRKYYGLTDTTYED